MGNNSLYEDVTKCCGCGACATECPVSAIEMIEDACGYIYPEIDSEKCIECGKCRRVCMYKKDNAYGVKSLSCFAAINKDLSMEQKSTSGGVFSAIATDFIHSNGVVVGAVEEINDNLFSVYHEVGCDESAIKRMQGSKYVQSNAYTSYTKVKQLLKEGKKVLFSGTPCQVDAIKSVTGNPDNLYTMDLICHGVPSQKLFRDAITLLEDDLHTKINHFIFRSKHGEDKGFNASAYCDGIRYEIPHALFSYYKLFLNGFTYRKNCYSCPYACQRRVADITIGDYWGLEKHHIQQIKDGEIDMSRYWSGILVNTDKGEKLLSEHGSLLKLIQSTYDKFADTNKQLKEPSKEPSERDGLLQLYKANGYGAVEKTYRKKMGGTFKFWLKRKLYIKKYKLGE